MAAAAYRVGEKLHSEYYGKDSDYTRKGGVICSEILLLSHAPPNDLQTAGMVERGKGRTLQAAGAAYCRFAGTVFCRTQCRGVESESQAGQSEKLQRSRQLSAYHNISTLSDLESRLNGYSETANSLKSSLADKEQRIKKLDRLAQLAGFFREGKPVYDKLNEIKWKKKREEYAAQHERTLDLFYMARRGVKALSGRWE